MSGPLSVFTALRQTCMVPDCPRPAVAVPASFACASSPLGSLGGPQLPRGEYPQDSRRPAIHRFPPTDFCVSPRLSLVNTEGSLETVDFLVKQRVVTLLASEPLQQFELFQLSSRFLLTHSVNLIHMALRSVCVCVCVPYQSVLFCSDPTIICLLGTSVLIQGSCGAMERKKRGQARAAIGRHTPHRFLSPNVCSLHENNSLTSGQVPL